MPASTHKAHISLLSETGLGTDWHAEVVPGSSSHYTEEENAAVDHFQDTMQHGEDGRYIVQLPKRSLTSPGMLSDASSPPIQSAVRKHGK